MSTSSKDKGIKSSATDDVISSYLDDLLGGAFVAVQNEAHELFNEEELSGEQDARLRDEDVCEPQPGMDPVLAEALASVNALDGSYLVPTRDLLSHLQSKAILPKPVSFHLLLLSLGLLRMPLSPRVRKLLLQASERMLDDYEAAEWQASVAAKAGLTCES